jgi:uncharacterized protein YkwD
VGTGRATAAAALATLVLLGSAEAAPACTGASDALPTTYDAAVRALPQVRATIACLVNRERTARGLRRWRADARLDNAAQLRANDLVTRRYFDHLGPTGDGAARDLAAQGFRFAEAGENLVRGFDTPEASVRAWLSSRAHCSILLDPALTRVGTGVAFGAPLLPQDGRGLVLFAVQIAARPAGSKAPRGSQRPRRLCPYWRVTPTETGWVWTLLRTLRP